MTDKVKTAIFGKDLRVVLKNYELNASGNKISIVPEGAGYFMPAIGPTNFLDWPSHKRYLLFGPRTYKRIFFALKKASKCVDFGPEAGIIYGPDEEQIKTAIGSTLLPKIGKPDEDTPMIQWLMLILLVLILLSVLGVLR